MDTAYYLAANGVPATKPYVLLREALKRSQKVAVAKFALRGRERLGMLRVVDDVIAMHGLLWPDEIRSTQEVAPDASVTVRDKELDLADALMDTLGEVELTELHDDYREAVEELIAAKASGELPAVPPAGERAGGKVLDLMAALEKSVRAAKVSRGEETGEETGARAGGSAEVTPLPSRRPAHTAPKEVGGKKSTSTAKKTAAKSTAKSTGQAAGKTAATRSTAKKTAARKTTAKKATGKKTAAKKATPRGRASA
jgi:DNA end-binding protein Ku